MKTSLKYFAIAPLILAGWVQFAFAQSDDSTAVQGHDFITSVARFPKDVRTSMLHVSAYPQTLIKIERIQAKSSQSFQDLIADYPREQQEQFYEASRYPERLNQLVRDGKKNTSSVDRYINDLPQDTQTKIKAVYNAHFNDLVKMNKIYQTSEKSMEEAIQEYPLAMQADFKKVIGKPDAMNLLTDNIDMAVSLGEDYQSQPDRMDAQLDSINAEVTSQDARTLADYKSKVENDPALQNEMKQASDNFSSTYTPDGSQNYNGTQPIVNNYYNYNPYPYWFSYPYWYSTPIWYPAPYYYYTGFYYGVGGRMVVWGLPAWPYTSWFYRYGYYRYPHMYSNYSYYHWNNRPIHYSSVYRGSRWTGRSVSGRYYSNHSSQWRSNSNYYNHRSTNVNTGRETQHGNYSNSNRSRTPQTYNSRSNIQHTSSVWNGSGNSRSTINSNNVVHRSGTFNGGSRLGNTRSFSPGRSSQVSHGSFGSFHSGGSRGGGGGGGGHSGGGGHGGRH